MKEAIDTLLTHRDFREGRYWTRRRVAAGETVLEQGSRGREVFLVESGSVRVMGNVILEGPRLMRSGVCDLPAGAVFGELALFDNSPRSASVVALSECSLIALDGDELFEFFEGHPDIGYRVLRALTATLVSRLRRTDRQLFSVFAWGLKAHDIERHL
ncbi:MAG: cyclic nucleotide-binding domain-containing protein [Gammaproteobacteria bacterium]